VTSEDLETFHIHTCTKALDLMVKKNSDYATSDDPFANFKLFENEALLGIVIRLGDKLRRLYKAASGGSMENETIEDTVLDIINYAIIFKAMLEEKNPKSFPGMLVEMTEIEE
jgi:hypothetical protein